MSTPIESLRLSPHCDHLANQVKKTMTKRLNLDEIDIYDNPVVFKEDFEYLPAGDSDKLDYLKTVAKKLAEVTKAKDMAYQRWMREKRASDALCNWLVDLNGGKYSHVIVDGILITWDSDQDNVLTEPANIVEG